MLVLWYPVLCIFSNAWIIFVWIFLFYLPWVSNKSCTSIFNQKRVFSYLLGYKFSEYRRVFTFLHGFHTNSHALYNVVVPDQACRCGFYCLHEWSFTKRVPVVKDFITAYHKCSWWLTTNCCIAMCWSRWHHLILVTIQHLSHWYLIPSKLPHYWILHLRIPKFFTH